MTAVTFHPDAGRSAGRLRRFLRTGLVAVAAQAIVAGLMMGTSAGVPTGPTTTRVLELEAVADTYVRADLDVRRNDNYGCQQFIAVGTKRDGRPDGMRSLVLFDLPDLESQEVVRATLELTVFGFDEGDAQQVHTVDVHRVVDSGPDTPWLEGLGFEDLPSDPDSLPPVCEGTDPADGVAWAGGAPTPGSDSVDNPAKDAENNRSQPEFDLRAVDRARIDQATVESGDVVAWDVSDTVTQWLDGSQRNYGLVLRDTTGDVFRGVRFGGREGLEFGIDSIGPPVAGPRLILEVAATSTCPSVSLGPTRLVGTQSGPNVSDRIPVDGLSGAYDLVLVSNDDVHAAPNNDSQPAEQWLLEGLDAEGERVFQTPPTDDLPDDVVVQETAVGRFDLTDVVAVRARHAKPGPTPNSVDAVSVRFIDGDCENQPPDRCDEVGDLVDLHDCRFEGVDFSDRSIRGTDFINTDFGGKLINSDLWQSSFRGADLRADMNLARLTGADLSDLVETGSLSIVDTDLTRADLSRSGYLLGAGQRAVLTDAQLRGAWLSMDLRNADLRRIRGFESRWAGSDLRRADLREAQLDSAGLNATGYPWAGVGFLPAATLRGTDLTGASLVGADLFGVDSRAADFSNADLRRARLVAADLRRADLSFANLAGANLTGARVDGAALTGVNWDDTVCPDGTNSNANSGSCDNALDGSARRRRLVGEGSKTVWNNPRRFQDAPESVVDGLVTDGVELAFVVLGPRVATDEAVWVEVETLNGKGWVDGRALRPGSSTRPSNWAPCEADAMLAAIADLAGGADRVGSITISECADGVARVFAAPVQQTGESEQVFLEDVDGEWNVFSSGTGIDCRAEPEGPQREVCRRLGLWVPEITAKVYFFDARRVRIGLSPFTAPVHRLVSAYDPEFEALEWLFVGPRGDEVDVDLQFVSSEATGFEDFTISDGVARVTLTGGCNSQGSTFVIYSEIYETLTQFPTVDHVKVFDPDGRTQEPDGASDSIPSCLEP